VKLSACMIVKNEEVMLEDALRSIDEVDEIIVCDTGSTDRTVEIAKRYTDKVYTDFTWCDDFSKARNHANSKATGNWILVIDADEQLLPGGVEEIRKAIEDHDGLAINVKLISGPDSVFDNIRVYRNTPEVYWKGAAHNYLSVQATGSCNAIVKYGYSPAHTDDPDRTLRILEKAVEEDLSLVREYYYLGREYFYKKRYEAAVRTLKVYVSRSTYVAERADAWLLMARCMWHLRRGEEARECCMKAIINNANFKEAVLFMAEISWEHNAKTWRKFAKHCTNENVLFVRVS
jgi:glycosyltransferase involved in cell wall biosynthesis